MTFGSSQHLLTSLLPVVAFGVLKLWASILASSSCALWIHLANDHASNVSKAQVKVAHCAMYLARLSHCGDSIASLITTPCFTLGGNQRGPGSWLQNERRVLNHVGGYMSTDGVQYGCINSCVIRISTLEPQEI